MIARSAIRLLGFAALLRAASASAEPPPAEATAQLLFEQGRDAMRRGAYGEACPKFAESQHLDPSNGTLLNLILCEEKLGKVASAWLHARELVERLTPDDPRKSIAERRLAALSPRIPRLALRASPDAPPGTSVSLDGAVLDLSSSPAPLPIDPGLHQLVVKAPNRADRTVELSAEEGQTYEFVAQPSAEQNAERPAPPAAAATPATAQPSQKAPAPTDWTRFSVKGVNQPESSGPPRWLGWTAGGVGVAALATSGVLGLMVLDRAHTVEEKCPNKECPRSEYDAALDTADEGEKLQTAALVSLAVGVAGVGFGIYTLSRSDGENGSSARASISATPSSAVLSYRAAF